jgi:hypothetical protein
MSNPTTPFGWQMPEATDLVTDLPADFEVFGQAVATDLQYLLGGTTGQVLAKASGTDLDFDWVTDASGMTNPMTTTADVIYSSSGSTPARLGIGTAGQVLQVNSGATAPEWATPASFSQASATATVATQQTTTSASFTDLATAGPAVTLTTGTKVLVIVSCEGSNASSNRGAQMDFAITGATSRSATVTTCLFLSQVGGDNQKLAASRANIVTVTAGSNTFTAKYRSYNDDGTSTFLNRTMIVMDLGS